MAVNLWTVSKWKKELDVLGELLHYDEATEGKVNRIRCRGSKLVDSLEVEELAVPGEWLHYDEATEGTVNRRIRCRLCWKHEDRLRAIRNYSTAFEHGISGSALKI